MKISAIVCAVALALAAFAPALALAQSEVPADSCAVYLQGSDFVGPPADLARLIDLQDTTSNASFVLRRAGRGYAGNACTAPRAVTDMALLLGTRPPGTGVRVLAPELLVVGNSAYPHDWNEGVLWSGRGLSTALSAGVAAQWGAFSAALAPVVTWQSNSEFDILPQPEPDHSEYGSAWSTAIDLPQRFGAGSFARIDAGQSYARVDVRGFGAGVSTENIRWGPSLRNPLLLSGTAGGFAHAFVETARPVDIWIGDLELQLFWGRLTESEYFDDDPDNDHRMLAGLLLALQPRVFEGLTVGAGRLQALTWWPELSLADVVIGPYRDVSSNPQDRRGDNQLITAFFRFATAPDGLEAYGEWAREDHWDGWSGLLRNLDASQAWTLGLQKVVRLDANALRLNAEVSHLSDALPIRFAQRDGGVGFYTNTAVRQGHTHRGQLLGAPIGTGAESLFVGADYFWDAGRSSLSVERARYNDDVYNVQFAPYFGSHARDTELTFRAGHLATLGPLSVDAMAGWSLRYNRDLLGLSEIRQAGGGVYRRDRNWSLRLGVRWAGGWAR
ncbi:MAG TPA: capsule assembly Wzi family protein [Longimicrobiales bacterium]|nr:capsule assembly Wzi family protein [Longimicrobiales bacterium]